MVNELLTVFVVLIILIMLIPVCVYALGELTSVSDKIDHVQNTRDIQDIQQMFINEYRADMKLHKETLALIKRNYYDDDTRREEDMMKIYNKLSNIQEDTSVIRKDGHYVGFVDESSSSTPTKIRIDNVYYVPETEPKRKKL